MESKGKVVSISRGMDGGFLITILLPFISKEELEKLKSDVWYRIKCVLWKEKRTLTQNDYLWKITDLIAIDIGSTRDEIHAEHMQKYGLFADGSVTIPAYQEPETAFPPLPNGNRYYFKFLGQSDDMKWKSYKRIRGTHEYDTKEFSHFLDLVLEEAREMGIEVLPDHELERMRLNEVNPTK